jgi:hypothetical protein
VRECVITIIPGLILSPSYIKKRYNGISGRNMIAILAGWLAGQRVKKTERERDIK